MLYQKTRKYMMGRRFFLLSVYKVVLKKVFNNMFLTLCDVLTGAVFAKKSGGMSSVKGSKRASFVAASEISIAAIRDTFHLNVCKGKFDFYLKTQGLDKTSKTTLRTFSNYFIKTGKRKIRHIKLRNLIINKAYCHNGMRSAKQRRV